LILCIVRRKSFPRSLIRCLCLEYTTDVLEEAKLYSIHAGRKQVELDDIKLACQNWAEEHSTMPSKDVTKKLKFFFSFFFHLDFN
jgi:hypothetical protein